MGFLSRLFGGGQGPGLGVDELARRLQMDDAGLRAVPVKYRTFQVPKKSGGHRTIHAPEDQLKRLQRKLNRCILARLPVHPVVTGFQPGHSIVTNAAHHAGKSLVVQIDVKDFFGSTRSKRVEAYFRYVGWNKDAAQLLTSWCTYKGALPQGAPTSPRLSNLVNYRLDARIAGFASKIGAAYTRYADDLTFSFGTDDGAAMRQMVSFSTYVLGDEGYEIHLKKKCHIRRRHQRQIVTGLVVNDRPRLPRHTRRWLRAVNHHLAAGRPTTVTPVQAQGWQALQNMIDNQWHQLQR